MTFALPPEELTYTVRPTLLRRAQHWCLQSDRLIGPHGTLELASVTGAALLQSHFGGIRVICLDLMTPQASIRIRFATTFGPRAPNPDQQRYLALISEIGLRLSQAVPTLTYRMEPPRRARLWRFAVGALLLLSGLLLTGLAFLTYVDQWPSLLASLPLLLFIKVYGCAIMVRFWPLRRAETFAIATLPFILWTMGGPRPEGIPHQHATPQP